MLASPGEGVVWQGQTPSCLCEMSYLCPDWSPTDVLMIFWGCVLIEPLPCFCKFSLYNRGRGASTRGRPTFHWGGPPGQEGHTEHECVCCVCVLLCHSPSIFLHISRKNTVGYCRHPTGWVGGVNTEVCQCDNLRTTQWRRIGASNKNFRAGWTSTSGPRSEVKFS